MKGGTSRRVRSPLLRIAAAMEPPGEGRYERGALDPSRHLVRTAAMEPPGEGRYEASRAGRATQKISPQWSRPVKGGTSPRRPMAATVGASRNGAAR